MQTINFISINVKNFLSIGDTPFNLTFQKGINVITGINHDKEDSKNGVGKSTIIDAVHFALFGTTVRELSKDFITNSYTNKKCEVIFKFEINHSNTTDTYEITRTLSPSKCLLKKNNADITLSTILKTNEFIQNLLRSSEKVFQNSVVMSMGSTAPFMAQSKIDKRKFIENILNLEIFSQMLSVVREEHNDIKKEYEISYNKKNTKEDTFLTIKNQIDLFESNKQQKIENLVKKIKENFNSIENLKSQIKTFDSSVHLLLENKEKSIIESKKTTDESIKKIEKKKIEIDIHIKSINSQILEIKEKGNVCTFCQRPYTEKEIHTAKEKLIELTNFTRDLQSKQDLCKLGLEKIHKEAECYNQQLQTIKKQKEKIKGIQDTNTGFLNKIQIIETLNEQLKEDILTLKNETNTHLEQVFESIKSELEQISRSVTGLNDKLKLYECAKFILSEEGVKSFIVKKMLTLLNSRIAYYLQKLNANCMCVFNEFFEDSIQSEDGVVRSYFNFSGGERKRIDLACLFAFLDIRRLQGNVHYSIIFYDELFDSALDNAGAECVFNVLRERYELYKESSYIITHRGEDFINRADNTIMLEKRNNLTYLIKQ